METFGEFLVWERADHDCVKFKTIYADIAGDILAGLLLSQLIYWYFLPGKDGNTKRRVHTADGRLWVVKAAHEWWTEVRLTPEQARRALRVLRRKGLVETEVHRFGGTPTTHIRIHEETFMEQLNEALHAVEGTIPSRSVPQHKSEVVPATDQNRAEAQIHNTDYPETTEAETTTSTCDVVDAESFNSNLACLSDLGILEPKRSELAGLPHVSPEYLQAWGGWYQDRLAEGRQITPGLLIVRIQAGDPVPAGNGRWRGPAKREKLQSTSEERLERYGRYVDRGPLAMTGASGEDDSLELTPTSV